MDEINIRMGELSDIPYLYEICLKTGNNGKDATDLFLDPHIIGHYFAAPYLLYPDGICFVAEHQRRPQGYIIAVPDTTAFKKWMEEKWLPPLRKQFPLPCPAGLIRSNNEDMMIKLFHLQQFPVDTAAQPYLADYPAHLHIDMLPSLQGKGLGRALMDRLFAELERQGVPGLHLGVSSANQGAIAFYKKLGFTVLKEFEWGFELGKLCKSITAF
jgi:ribosomal protein S18 acetylase RimI-like enzyme